MMSSVANPLCWRRGGGDLARRSVDGTSELHQKDRLLLAAIGLLSYFALSGVLAPMGLLIDPISGQLDLSDVEAASCCLGFPRAI